jgi:hypothetical protein
MHSLQMYTFGPATIFSTSRCALWQKLQERPAGLLYFGIGSSILSFGQ